MCVSYSVTVIASNLPESRVISESAEAPKISEVWVDVHKTGSVRVAAVHWRELCEGTAPHSAAAHEHVENFVGVNVSAGEVGAGPATTGACLPV